MFGDNNTVGTPNEGQNKITSLFSQANNSSPDQQQPKISFFKPNIQNNQNAFTMNNNSQGGLFGQQNNSQSWFSSVPGQNQQNPQGSLFGSLNSGEAKSFQVNQQFGNVCGFTAQGNENEDDDEEKIYEPYDKNQVYESYWKPKIPNKELTPIQQFKVVVVGDGGVGKTGFVKNLLGMEFPQKYIATVGTEVIPLPLMTNYGLFSFTIWDTAGQEKLGGLREGYYIGAHCAIIMFDLTSRITYRNVPKWYKDVCRICSNIPKVLVGNKAEIVEVRKIDHKSIKIPTKTGMPYCEISSKTGYQCEKPLLYLLRMMTNNGKIELLGESVPQPEEPTTLTEEEIQELIGNEDNAEDVPLPESKDKEFGASSKERDD